MGQRKLDRIEPDDLFREWQNDIQRIEQDLVELFWMRLMYRRVREVFDRNTHLQSVGGFMFEWIRMTYASTVLMRLRREVDTQNNVVSLRNLLDEIAQRPDVVCRRRWRTLLKLPGRDDSGLGRMLDDGFTEKWVTERRGDPDDDFIGSEVIARDVEELGKATAKVEGVAHRTVAHRTREVVDTLNTRDVDDAMETIETTLKRYYALLTGKSLVSAEPTIQYNAHEVFTFPWDDTCYAKWAGCSSCSQVDWSQIRKARGAGAE